MRENVNTKRMILNHKYGLNYKILLHTVLSNKQKHCKVSDSFFRKV